MASLGSDGATQADAGSQLSAARRDSDMTDKLQKARSLTIRLLKEITDDFSDERKIGQGTYGKVYVAKLENGEDIAVKILHNSMPGNDDAQFLREFENLMRLDHHNIVKLVGYCYETQHEPMQYFGRTIFTEKTYRALCFEYMENGSLQKHLSDECSGLDWNTRYKIIKGAWEGLKHLHEGFEEPIYHLDLKPDNILLDNNMLPKLADFGMSKLFNDQHTMMTQSPIGTFGYLPIEFLHQNIVSNKLDIFSLGVVMIKIIGGPEAHTRSDEMGHEEFVDQVHANWRNRMQNTCASGLLEAYCEQVNICMEIALTCMEIDRHRRPNIADIIYRLNDTETMIDEALSWSASWPRMTGYLVNLRAFTGSQGILDTATVSMFPVMVQVTAPPWRPAEETARPGVDIVVVFDIVHYNGKETEVMINKLSSKDRLSLVRTGTDPRLLMGLTFMDDKGKADVDSLFFRKHDPNHASIEAGLREAVEILRGREAEEGDSRVGCILVLSDTEQLDTWEISSEFPVHTVGLYGHNPYGLTSIADYTSGTYSFCGIGLQHVKNALELVMAGIVKVAATSIKITLRAHEGEAISSIMSGRHGNKVSIDKLSAEIDIRDIYAGETKNFIVYLTVAEGKKKLVTIGGQYRSSTATIVQLRDKHVFVLRPRSAYSRAVLAMHHDVAAELARIQFIKGVWGMGCGVGGNRYATFVDGHFPPGLDHFRHFVNQMKELSEEGRSGAYMCSWLSCHEWQRATAKGGYYESGAFALAQPQDADGEDDDSTKEFCHPLTVGT